MDLGDDIKTVFREFLAETSEFDLDDVETSEELYGLFSRYVSGSFGGTGAGKSRVRSLLDEGREYIADWWDLDRYGFLAESFSDPLEGCVRVFSVACYDTGKAREYKTRNIWQAAATAKMYRRGSKDVHLLYLDIPEEQMKKAVDDKTLLEVFEAEMDIQCGCEEIPKGLWV